MIKPNKQRLFNYLIGLTFALFIVILLNPSRVKQTFAIDACVEDGGHWDYQNKVCEGINGQVSD
jgi:hypothetical protein